MCQYTWTNSKGDDKKKLKKKYYTVSICNEVVGCLPKIGRNLISNLSKIEYKIPPPGFDDY